MMMTSRIVIPAKAGIQYLNRKFKTWAPVFAGATALWSVMSLVAHAGAVGGIYYFFVKRTPPPIVADLDLSMTPLTALPPNAGGGYGRISEKWVAPKKNQKAPLPAVVEKPQTKEDVVKEESQTTVCPEPCPQQTGIVGSGWGGGTGQGDGEYAPVGDGFRKPRWVRNFITSSDYPLIARQEGKDGRVVLTVLIDADGRVRDARLLQGSYAALNEVALRKIKSAVFTPAYNEQNKPVSCKVMLPIRFELR